MTFLGFEPGACIYLAALTTESSQLVKLREEMVKESHNRLMICLGYWWVIPTNCPVHSCRNLWGTKSTAGLHGVLIVGCSLVLVYIVRSRFFDLLLWN